MLGSVQGYLHNLNTGRAYHELRSMRARARSAGQIISGADLATSLVSYSERGEAYVRALQSIIRANDLVAYDRVLLARSEEATIILPEP